MINQVAIGITGSFGSGCSTVAEVLGEEPFNYKVYSLSDFLKEEWSKRTRKPVKEALRSQLQDFGNQLRKEHSLSFLAEETYKKVCEEGNGNKNLVFDSIRNPAEIAFLRSKFPNFYVIAVDCAEADRWDRVKKYYEEKNLTYADFRRDDKRDKNEDGIIFGQQVALCVDEADYLIRNDNEPMVTTKGAIKRKLREKLQDPIDLFSGKSPRRPPSDTEVYMSIAYAASLLSHCFKRQVGAVIIDEKGTILGIGYNENPKPLKPCYEQFGDCFREIYIEEIMATFKICPFCKKELNGLIYPYNCPHCKTNIYEEIVRDRALGRCTALHAEEKAIIDAHSQNMTGCTLYVTTFPCFTCAQKILNVGIETICYVESYPDIDSIKLFETARKSGRTLTIDKFEGVKARAYFKLFGVWRRERETEMLKYRRS
ncbi:MAG: deaminase [Candidatus Bathyarchaeia archaeon]